MIRSGYVVEGLETTKVEEGVKNGKKCMSLLQSRLLLPWLFLDYSLIFRLLIFYHSGKKQQKVLRKIPPAVLQQALGLAIFTSMRSGIAPFGGAGGTGLVIARLPDGGE